MGEYNWQTIRDRAASVLGYPDAATAQPIIDQFEENPAAVSQAVDKIVSRVRAGKLQAHAGWLIIGREAEAIGRPAPNVVANDEGEKQRRLAGALKWVDHTGLYFDRPEAVLDELFGGAARLLSDYADDRALRDLVERHWREQRPLGEAAEAEHERWCLKCARAGKLQAHAGWLIIGREAEAIGRPAPNVVANDEGEKQRRLAGALKWVDHTGLYFDRPEAVLDQLEVVTVEELAAQYEPTPWDDAYHPGPVDNDELLAWGMPWGRDWQLGWS
jgi:hypothetical protein